jgi:hypothetical protein
VFFSFVCDDLAVSLWVIMGKNITVIIQWVGCLVYFIELIIASRVSKSIDAPSIMRKFYWYPIVGVIITIFFALKNLNFIPNRVSFTLNLISLIFHYSFLSFFIFNETNKNNKFKVIIFLCSFILIVLIALDIINSYTTSFAFANGCLFLFSLYYFRKILIGKVTVVLNNNPVFYICCGIFIGAGIIVPSSLMIKYLYLLNVSNDYIHLFAAVWGLGYIIMNLIFIKALLLCLKPNK